MLRKDIDTLKELVIRLNKNKIINDSDIAFLENIIEYEDMQKKKHSTYVISVRDNDFRNLTKKLAYYKRKTRLNPLQEAQYKHLQDMYDKHFYDKLHPTEDNSKNK